MSSQYSNVSAIPAEVYEPAIQEDSIARSLFNGRIIHPAQYTHFTLDADELTAFHQAKHCIVDGVSRAVLSEAYEEMEKSVQKVDNLREKYSLLWDELTTTDQRLTALNSSIQKRNGRVTFNREWGRTLDAWSKIPDSAMKKFKGPTSTFGAGALFEASTAVMKEQTIIALAFLYAGKVVVKAYENTASNIPLIEIPEATKTSESDLYKIELSEKDIFVSTTKNNKWYQRCVSLINSTNDAEEGIGKAPIISVLETLNKNNLRVVLLEKCLLIFNTRLGEMNQKIRELEMKKTKEEFPYWRIGANFFYEAACGVQRDLKSALGYPTEVINPEDRGVQNMNSEHPKAAGVNKDNAAQ